MNLSEIGFKRQFLIKDLYTIESFIQDSGVIEFSTFEDFVDYLPFIYKDLNIGRLIIPVNCTDHINIIKSLLIEERPFITLKIDNLDVYLWDICNIDKCTILCHHELIKKLRSFILTHKDDSKNFVNFISSRKCYFRDSIKIDDLDNIIFKYSDPYLTFPFFSIADINWDWVSFEELKCKDIFKVLYQLQHLCECCFSGLESLKSQINKNYTYDLANTKILARTINLKEFTDENKSILTSLDFRRDSSFKEIIWENNTIRIKDDNNFIDLNKINKLSFEDLNFIRTPFDIKVPFSCDTTSLINLALNKKCTGSYTVPSEFCKIVCNKLGGFNE